MANAHHVKILKIGVQVWNNWREEHPKEFVDFDGSDFSNADLSDAQLAMCSFNGANLSKAILSKTTFMMASFSSADLSGADLSGAKLYKANLFYTNLRGANLSNAWIPHALLYGANLTGANLTQANLIEAHLSSTDLTRANLTGANLEKAILSETILEGATLANCNIYGLSAWDLKGKPKDQTNLIITPKNEPAAITVDNLQIAQFVYLLLNNANVRDVIDTITSKVILILGRFTDERKLVLDAIRTELRSLNFTPILFDFDKPTSKDLTGTVETLARMARFIIADITDPSSVPHELATIIPSLRTTPILPIRLKGSIGYSMLLDLQKDLPHRVLKTYEYENCEYLIANLQEVIGPVNHVAENFRKNS